MRTSKVVCLVIVSVFVCMYTHADDSADPEDQRRIAKSHISGASSAAAFLIVSNVLQSGSMDLEDSVRTRTKTYNEIARDHWKLRDDTRIEEIMSWCREVNAHQAKIIAMLRADGIFDKNVMEEHIVLVRSLISVSVSTGR